MISLKQLTYALAAEQTLHFKKAADMCNVSQSAFSIGLNELEKQLGVQIFERDNKKVLITPLGKEVLKKARTIVAQVGELEQLSETQGEPLSHPLDIGVIPTIAPYLLPKILPTLRKRHPKAELNIVEERSHTQVEMVRNGEIDAAIMALPYSCEGLLAFEFWQEDFFWVARKGGPFTELPKVGSTEIAQSNLMLLKNGHCLKDHAVNACKLPEQTANHGFGATSLNTLIEMVIGNMGSTLIPAMAHQQLVARNRDLISIPLEEPGPHRRIAFVVRPNYTRLPCIEALMATCREALEKSR